MEKENRSKPTISSIEQEWISRLKQESWEAELLVSALAVFGSFKLFGLSSWIVDFFIVHLPESQYMVAYSIALLYALAVSGLSVFFVIHLILRGYWVGLVGLNSVFPDYGLKTSMFSRIYTKKITASLPKLSQSINQVDRLSSVVFSVAFSMLFIYLYAAVIGTAALIIYNVLIMFISEDIAIIPIYIALFIVCFQFLVSILANTSYLKKNTRVQLFYFHVNRMLLPVFYGPLYNNILQVLMVFTSNYKTSRAIFVMMSGFLFTAFLTSQITLNNTRYGYLIIPEKHFTSSSRYTTFYASENAQKSNHSLLLSPEIPSDIISDTHLRVFIPIFYNEKTLKNERCKDTNKHLQSADSSLIESDDTDMVCYAKYHQFKLNDTLVKPELISYYHPVTEQFGALAYIEVAHLPIGEYKLTVSKLFADDSEYKVWYIPFRL
ncbi:hypothetical protein [Alteromonas stellipolaris]|uniref:hypothetical protein n=1 Tax=Alteromonas stellipolaris TaxID=233316 RepID=UPI001D909975|nr:hypothetical protein [Alteromonas stellipolaris]MBZ2162118.1 hypothetical protein [Alteromonas stellipolaris]